MEKESDKHVLAFYTRKLTILLKISGAIPMNICNTKASKLFSLLYMSVVSFCSVYTIFETLLFMAVNIQDNGALFKGLWIKTSLLLSDLQLISFFVKRAKLEELLKFRPVVVTDRIGEQLKRYMKRAKQQCHLIIWIYIFISVTASITLEFRTKFSNEEDGGKAQEEEDFIVALLNNDRWIQELIKYVHYGSFSFFGLFQLVAVMLYIHICCFIQGYADHLADAIGVVVLSSGSSSHGRDWASYHDCNVFDIRYVATMHQHVNELIVKANSIYSMQNQLRMWRIIMVLCLTAKEITDHAEVSRLSIVLSVEFATNMWELFIFGWLAENLAEARDRFKQEVTYQLAINSNIHSADYTSLQVMAVGSNIKYSLHAGPFYKLSYKTFNAIIAVSYTYYSFLKNVKA